MPTFSSVVHKPGRKVVAPKAVPRRNVQRASSTAVSVASTAAQSPLQESATPTTKVNGSTRDHTHPASPTIVQAENLAYAILKGKQTRQKTASDNVLRQSTNQPPAVLPTGPAFADASAVLQQGYDIQQPTLALPTEGLVAGAQDGGLPYPQRDAPKSLAGRKRKAVELGSNRLSQSDSQVSDGAQEQAQGLQVNHPTPESQIAPEIALSSLETSSAAPITSKPKRAVSKPRAQPRAKNAAQTASAATGPPNSTTNQDHNSQVVRPSNSRAQSGAWEDADTLLQNVTSQFSAVSRLANGIHGTSRASILSRSGSCQPGSVQATADLANSLNRAASRRKRARNAADLASEIIDEAVGVVVSEKARRRRRKRIPDGAEEHTIDPAETKMRDLARDTGLGKKSGIEMELEKVDWKLVKQQRKEMAAAKAERQDTGKQEKRSGKPKKQQAQDERQEDDPLVPKMAIVNGVIVLDPESREINRRAEVEAEAAREDVEVVALDKLTTRKNQNTIGKPKGLQGKQLQWSEEMDERFYKGIRMFGTDMLMVSSLFPKLERRHVKHKFVREERANPEKLREALFNPIVLDAETYQQETGLELSDPRELDEELKAMETELRKRYEETQAEQQVGAHPVETDDADIPIPSREHDNIGPETGAAHAQSGRPSRRNRFDAVADDIVNDALGVRPAGTRKSKKKGAAATSAHAPAGRRKKDGSVAGPRKGTKAAKQAAALQQLGGTVEAIGTIDE